jgi:nitrogen fixation protein FixH
VVRARDYDSAAAITADRVSLRFTFLDSPLAGTSTLTLARAPDGSYSAQGTNLSLDGRWRVTVVIERGAASVEVPLELRTRRVPQKIEVIPGTPTLYDVTISPGRTVQMYVDPGKPGSNEVHATFFLDGGEFAGLKNVVVTAATDGRAPESLPLRTLGPGHFVAQANLTAGTWTFTVRAVAPDGAALQAYFEHTIV